MEHTTGRRFAAGTAALALGASAVLAPGAAEAAAPLKCHAHMSNAHPKQYSTTIVLVDTAGRAYVRTVAHYKTTNHPKRARADRHDNAAIPYDISDATVGYKVKVTVTVHKGSRYGHCSTSFTPRG